MLCSGGADQRVRSLIPTKSTLQLDFKVFLPDHNTRQFSIDGGAALINPLQPTHISAGI